MSLSKVYFGSINHGSLSSASSLARKLEIIIDNLDLTTIKKKDKVAVKMHLGYTDGAQTIHPFYVRKVIEKIKTTGATPYITDTPTSAYNAAQRGYTQETCGCPIIPIAGIKDQYSYPTDIKYRNIDTMNMAGVLHDSDVLINLSHVKSQNNVGYAAAVKNLGVGGFCGSDRWGKIHGIFKTEPFWNPDKSTPEHAEKLVKSCPYEYIKYDKEKHDLVIERGRCFNGNCFNCLEADSNVGCLNMSPEAFETFDELLAIGTKKILDVFDAEKVFHLNFLMDMTPTCDCMGVVQPQIVPDIGIAASKDIVAVEQASIDLIGKEELIWSKVPPYFKHLNKDTSKKIHPFQRLWGPLKDPYNVTKYAEKYGLGSRNYDLMEILPAEETINTKDRHIYERGLSFA